MGLAIKTAAPIRRAKKTLIQLLSLVLIVSTLSAISIVKAPEAIASLTNENCAPTVSGLTASAIANGSDCIITFTSGTGTWTVPSGVITAQVLVVGGGGGGGTRHAGGGGAGGVVYATSYSVSGSVGVQVGAGGSGGGTGGSGGTSGTDSRFFQSDEASSGATGLTAKGGGFGDFYTMVSNNIVRAGSGGSGGGAGVSDPFTRDLTSGYTNADPRGLSIQSAQSQKQLSGTTLSSNFNQYGNNGGGGGINSYWGGGGGGGAGGAGGISVASGNTTSTGSTGGAGGIGVSIPITGSDVFYAGGGGGGSWGLAAGAGGSGGGGGGTNDATTATVGTANTGGGGGGGGMSTGFANGRGAAGGSGVVVVRYANPTRTITYALNSGTGTTPTQAAVSDGATFVVASGSGLSHDGFSFVGWNDGTTNVSAGSTYTVGASAITLTAQWTANTNNAITYNNQSATTAHSGGSTTYTTAAAIATIPTTAPLRTGFTFAGWYTASTGGTPVTNGSYTPPSPYGAITLFAQWTANTNNSITYDNQSATTTHSGGSTTYTSAVAIATIPTTAPLRTNFTFVGWFTASSGGTQVTNGSYTPPSPYGTVTLYAQWLADVATPTIGTQPTAAAKTVGQSVTFTVLASKSDAGVLSYQWQKLINSAWTSITGVASATSASYSFTTTATSDAGDYRVIVTNTLSGATATATSNVVALTMSGALTITTPTSGLSGSVGAAFTTLNIISAGGSGTNTFALASGDLPDGLSLSTSGAITGTPTTVGTQAITVRVTDSNTATATTTSFTISITAGAATKVAVTRATVGTQRGAAFSTQPQVTVQDAGGNTVTSSSAVVTATVSAGGTLVGTVTATAASGVATFTGLGVNGTIGTTYTTTYTVSGLTVATATVTLTGTTCDGSFTCQIGDTGPGGGIIFYVAPTFFTQGGASGSMCTTNCKYLEAAPTSGTNAWTDAGYVWSGNTNTAIGTTARGTSIGTGYANTLAIVGQSSTANRAGTISRAYRGPNNLDNWFLPSTDELNQMCKWQKGITGEPLNNLATVCTGLGINLGIGAAGFLSDWPYWSSTETTAERARYQWFDAHQGDDWKTYNFRVRPIRAFGPAPIVISTAAIAGVTAPVAGATPVTTTTAGTGYTGAVTWSGSPTTFATGVTYTATITLTAAAGYTLTGVTANFFTVTGATPVTHSANTGVITAVFPATTSSNVATLSALTLTTATLSSTFASGTTSYTSSVVNGTTSITVTPTRTQANATITVNGTGVTSGSASGAISLNVGANTITVVVTAQDGSTTATYTVTVTRASSSDANLSAFTISSGTLSTAFSAATITYTATVTNATTSITVTPTRNQANATITVNSTAVTSGSASGSISLNTGNNTITVVVTAQDGTTTKTYTLTIKRLGPDTVGSATFIGTQVAWSSNTYFDSFSSQSGVTTTDAVATNNMVWQMFYAHKAITIPADGISRLGINTYQSGNNSLVWWISKSSSTNTVGSFSTPAQISAQTSYSYSAGGFNQAVANSAASIPANTYFIVGVTAGPYYRAIKASGNRTATAAGENIVTSINTVFLGPWGSPNGPTNGVPTALGGTLAAYTYGNGGNAEYTQYDGFQSVISIKFKDVSSISNDASLSALVTSTGTLSPTFDSATTPYSAAVSNATTSITVTPTRTNTNATIKVNGTTVTSGSASSAISLNVGSNTITVVGTAEDGTTTSTYTLTITRASSDVATLLALALTTATLSPSFLSTTTSYTASVVNTTTSITVTPTRTQANAAITVNGTAVTSGSASGAISLNVGANTITVVVTAQNGTTTATYTVTVTRATSNVATLSALVLSTGTLSPFFASGTITYTASVANSVSTGFTVTPTTTQTNATTVQYLGSSGTTAFTGALAVGANVIRTVVTAQNGTTTATYTVTVTRAAEILAVTFNANDGSGSPATSSQSITSGAATTLSSNTFTRTGYSFNGWNTNADETTGTNYTNGQSVTITAGITLFAKWSGNSLVVTYNSQSGTVVTSGSVATNAKISAAPTPPTRAGYTFSGWSTSTTGSVVSFTDGYTHGQTANFTLFAIWAANALTITYDSKSGSSVTNGSVNTAASISATPTAPTRAGYTLAGWSATDGGTVVTFPYAHGQTANFTMYAKWTAVTTNGISYNNQGATTSQVGGSTTYTTDAAIATIPTTAPLRVGYTFAGWFTESSAGIQVTNGTHTPASPFGAITLYAQWTANSLTVTYNSKGGTTVSNGSVNTAASISTAPTAPTRTGYTFSAWSATDGGIAITFPYAHSQTANFTLYAIWAANALTITYDSQGGSAVTAGSVNTAASISTAPTAPTKTGYTLSGWSTTEAGTVVTFPFAHGQTANFTLYARWSVKVYVVAFNANSGTGTMGSQSFTHGVATNLNANLYSRVNYVFHRWATAADGTGTTYSNFAQAALTTETTLYAQWTANTYVVTFNYNGGNGGDSTATANFTTAGTAITLPVPTKNGFTFAGWHSDAALSNLIGSGGGSGSYSPTGATLSLNAYAKWTAINYTFTYNSNFADSGNVPTETTKQISQTATVKANTGVLALAGYTFSGWNTASDGTGTNYLSGSLFTVGSSNVTLYANWSANTYTVTYNTNGGTGNAQRSSTNVTSDTYTTGGSSVVFPGVGTLERTGFTFGGWNTSAAGTGSNYSATNTYTTVSSVIFYAKWNPVTYTITYNGNTSNGGSEPTAGGYTTGQASPYVVLANTFTKTSNVFGGWNTAANGTGTSYSPSASITTLANIILYATWIPQFTLHYAINGGTVTSGSLPIDTLHNSGTSVGPIFGSVSRTGYTFAGWANGSATILGGSNFTILEDSVLTAKWNPINYAISYNSDGGTEAPATSTKQIGQSFTVEAAASKPGYNFTGWSNSSTIVGADAVVVMGSANIAYTAQWVARVYTVSYDWNGGRGTAVADVNYTFGTTAITLPLIGDKVKDGYTFAGWSESTSGSLLSSTYIPSQSRTLYALWTLGNFTVTYNLSGGTLANASVAIQNGSAIVLPLPTRANFVFDGWHTATAGGSSVGSNGTSFTPTASQTVYARWIQSSLFGIVDSLTRIGSVFTVANVGNTFSGANSSSSVAVSVPMNALPAGTTINFDMVGNSSRATGLLPNVTYLISIAISWIAGDGTVPDTASGKPILVTISNASIKTGATAYAIVNNVSTLLGTATQDGTITIELTSDPEIVIAAVKPSAPLNVATTTNGNQQSVISWSAPASNGGSEITGYTVTSNTNATCTTSTTSCTISGLANGTAYTFTVTAANTVGTSVASSSASATTAALYTVTFNAKGGTTVTSGTFLTASTVTEPTAPTRAGYSFAGWSATDGGSAVIFPYAPGVTSNITMFARWDALDNAVTFDSKSGSDVTASVFSSGGTVSAPTAPTRSGYTFAGWSATDGGTAVTFPYTPNVVTDITLYAKWTVVSQNNSGGSSGNSGNNNSGGNSGNNNSGGNSSSQAGSTAPGRANVTTVAPVTVIGNQDAKVIAIEVAVPPVGSGVKPPQIKIDSLSEKFIADVKVVEGKLVLTPETGFSGRKIVTVTITEGGVDRVVQIPLTVLPEVVTKPVITPMAFNRSNIRWTQSPNADAYTVYLNGKKVCATSAINCSIRTVLGPKSVIEIVSNGGDRTVSQRVDAEFKQNTPVVVTRLVSATITKTALSKVDIKALDQVVSVIKTQGFTNIVISNITTTKKTEALAAARIAVIKKYISDKTGSKDLIFEVIPATSRTYLNNIAVKG